MLKYNRKEHNFVCAAWEEWEEVAEEELPLPNNKSPNATIEATEELLRICRFCFSEKSTHSAKVKTAINAFYEVMRNIPKKTGA